MKILGYMIVYFCLLFLYIIYTGIPIIDLLIDFNRQREYPIPFQNEDIRVYDSIFLFIVLIYNLYWYSYDIITNRF